MQRHTTQLGGLKCRLVDAIPQDRQPQMAVVICHGFGAPGRDLVPIASELVNLSPDLSDTVRFIFPAAPLSPDEFASYGGRAWWPMDVERILAAIEGGDTQILRKMRPEGLPDASQMLESLIGEVQQQTGLPMSRIVLGGFSQGAMLATDLTLRLSDKPAALCVWSGTLLCEELWKPMMPSLEGLPILQSHGRQDPILPFQAGLWLREMLVANGAEVDFIEFNGDHTVPFEALQRFALLLGQLAAK